MRLEQPPLLHDGGYWYVVPVVTVDGGFDTAETGVSTAKWYNLGEQIAIIRTITPLVGVNTLQIPASQVITGVMPIARFMGL